MRVGMNSGDCGVTYGESIEEYLLVKILNKCFDFLIRQELPQIGSL